MVKNYLGNDVYEYTLSSGTEVTLSGSELFELMLECDEYKVTEERLLSLKFDIRKIEKLTSNLYEITNALDI